jgi:hypothetical protein
VSSLSSTLEATFAGLILVSRSRASLIRKFNLVQTLAPDSPLRKATPKTLESRGLKPLCFLISRPPPVPTLDPLFADALQSARPETPSPAVSRDFHPILATSAQFDRQASLGRTQIRSPGVSAR